MKLCPRCQQEVKDRKKFCSNSCKYWYNTTKKENEKYLPPVKKRNKQWCNVYTSIGNTINQRGQGKRSGGMIKGSMAANVSYQICTLKPFNLENVKYHFTPKNDNSFIPPYIMLGDGTRLTEKEAIAICEQPPTIF